MKKYYVIILCLLFIAGVTSCATSEERKSAPTAVTNPVTELETPDFETAGFKITEYPVDYKFTRCALIAGSVGEMNFDISDGAFITFRMAKHPVGEIPGIHSIEDISGVHYEFTEITNFDSKNVPVTVKKAFEPSYNAVCTWDKDGYTFSLWIEALEEPADPVKLAEDFVENVVIEPKQV